MFILLAGSVHENMGKFDHRPLHKPEPACMFFSFTNTLVLSSRVAQAQTRLVEICKKNCPHLIIFEIKNKRTMHFESEFY
jgi:hypothetical protein